MRRTSSFGLGLSVCGAVAALAVGPARADDGVTTPAVPTDATAIVASVAAAVPSMPEPQGPAAPQTPVVPETPVIPSVSPTVPPVIPPEPAAAEPTQTVSPEPQIAPAPPATPVVAAQPEPTPTPQPAPAAAAAPATPDTANTTPDNSNGITLSAPQNAPQTFIWNWYWNCATDEGTPSVPAPPAGATTVVLNWHWACADPPPTLDVAGITVCTACNIAISVRVGSPGNTGDVAQTIAAQTAAAATGLAHTIQTALQTVPTAATPLPPMPPAVVIPAVAPPATLAVLAPGAHAFAIDAGIVIASLDPSGEDPPRHGAPTSFGAAPPPGQQQLGAIGVDARVASLPVATETGLLSFSPQRSSARREGAGSSGAAGARRPARAPAAPTPSPSAPTPFVLAAGAPSTHGGGLGAVAAIAAALTLAFLYAVYSALRTPPAVPPAGDGGAKPHPPG